VNTASGVQGLGVEDAAVLEFRIEVAARACGEGGGQLQAKKLAAAVQSEVAPGENGRMTTHATDPGSEHSKGFLGRLVVVAMHLKYRTAAMMCECYGI